MSINSLKVSRRMALLAGGAALLAPRMGMAQAYPSKNVSFVCAFPAGSGADILVRYFANKFQEKTGQTVIVENRPGAASNIAAEYTMRAAPDGYTLFVHSGNSIAGNVWMLKNPPLNPAKDLRTVATMHMQSFLITVRADSPYKTLADLVADQMAKGDAGSYAVSATSGVVMAEEFKQVTGLKTNQVRYGSTAESVNDMLSGHVDFGAHDPAFSLAQQKAGRFRILAVASPERMPGMPDIPTFVEQGFQISQPGWWGVMGPAGLPDDIANEVNRLFNELLSEEANRKFLEDQGGTVLISTPAEAQKLMEDTVDEWKRLVEIAKIEPQ